MLNRPPPEPGWRGLHWRSLARLADLAHPLWLCPFRPFFALAVLSALGLMAAWGLFLLLGWPLPAVPGGPFVWHAHELLLGFALAATAGFALTAVPEFTGTPPASARAVRRLALLWLAGCLAFWASGWWPQVALALSALAHLGLLLGLAALLAPPLWRDAQRRHLSFLWAIALMAVAAAGFYMDALRGLYPMRWLHALLGVLMALIVIAMSRISMRVVNDAIDAHAAARAATAAAPAALPEPYLARPPRRNMALLCIGLCALAQWAQEHWDWAPLPAMGGWLALAASAAVLALMGDWHVGRPLLTRWPLLLYLVYACMAAGYGLLGLAGLGLDVGLGLPPGAGWHLLAVGAMGLAVFVVMVIAGYTHSGLDKAARPWVPAGAACLLLGALCRLLAYAAAPASLWLGLAAALWCAAFALMAWHMLPVWLAPRSDAAEGCAGLAQPQSPDALE
ncbi:NnrS family protein [Vandammella animalimorsus]|uniref:NnrS family protein n=1 Tax=Vandammella animalimorsus TaxID=2029117 RepID=A0A2A2ARZ4_9BURK|nr:NnrS family protein [Vandammella animalimorsus]PAT40464.1 NnrS family protein [Vandammella animalimorsus]